MAPAVRPPRLVWLAAAVLCLALEFWLWRLPLALELPAEPIGLAPGEQLVLRAPAAAEGLLNLHSLPGEAVDLRFEQARLGFDTLALMRSAGAEPSGDSGAIQWLNDAQPGATSVVGVRLPESAAAAELVLGLDAGSRRTQPELEVRVDGAELAVGMASARERSAAVATADMRLIELGQLFRLPGALPVQVDVAAGGSMRIAVSAQPPPWEADGRYRRLRLGATGAPDRLVLRAFGIRRAGNAEWRMFACAAPPRGLLWSSAALAAGRCEQGPVAPGLALSGLALRADGFEFAAGGSAWVWADGTARRASLAERWTRYPAYSAALTVPAAAALLFAVLGLRGPKPARSGPHPRVFISYRRQDTASMAGRLFDRLALELGRDQVFRDLYGIAPGEQFAQVIEQVLARADAALVLIGPRWLERDAAGARRIDQPDDFVRREVAQALRQKITVLPLLVDGAAMPAAAQLPADIAGLTDYNALDLSDARFDDDLRRLLGALHAVASRKAANGQSLRNIN
ncbi:MAG: toll/interleukin-1 receptor domain-containing protein [Rhodocyclaceae bacterium]|nr:toll/interleukin-1 receptor domain-containing protein [Rhodocyclaceae bacterium]